MYGMASGGHGLMHACVRSRTPLAAYVEDMTPNEATAAFTRASLGLQSVKCMPFFKESLEM